MMTHPVFAWAGARWKHPTGSSWCVATNPVQPAQRVSFLVTADALGRWAWHCHLMLHMDMGMFRVVVVS